MNDGPASDRRSRWSVVAPWILFVALLVFVGVLLYAYRAQSPGI